MNNYLEISLFLCVFLISINTKSADIPLIFKSSEKTSQYQSILEEIRCLVCQNQSLADSHADLAQDLRVEIYKMVKAGKEDKEIIDFLVQRYGDFVLYRPPVKSSTWLLWTAPFMLLIISIFVVIFVSRRQGITAPEGFSETEKQKLSLLLDNNQEDK